MDFAEFAGQSVAVRLLGEPISKYDSIVAVVGALEMVRPDRCAATADREFEEQDAASNRNCTVGPGATASGGAAARFDRRPDAARISGNARAICPEHPARRAKSGRGHGSPERCRG